MNGFFDRLEAQLHAAAQAQTGSSWARMRTRWGWLRTGKRIVPMLAALAVTVGVAAVAFTIGGHAHRLGRQSQGVGSGPAATSTATTNTATTPGGPPASAPPPGQDNLTGTWSGHYSGANSGTLTITWQQSGWKEKSPGVFRSNLDGSIKLSASPGTLTIHGTVLVSCPRAPCNHGDTIKFGTVGGGITYRGTVSQPHMSGSYQTATGGGSWSANQVGAP